MRIVGLRVIYGGREGEYEGYFCRVILHADVLQGFPDILFPSKRVMTGCERHCISICSEPTRL